MRELVLAWYVYLSSLNAAVAAPLRDLADGSSIPLVGVLLLGVLGATSPCQLTTNASAVAFVGRRAGGGAVTRGALAFAAGKVATYTVIGLAVLLVGQQLEQASIPAAATMRRLLGPAMVALGLYVLGAMPMPRVAAGLGTSARLEAAARAGSGAPFLLGAAFALAFCPALFLLFFGITLPLAGDSSMGFLYPAAFASGTALPVVGAAMLLTFGLKSGRLAGLGGENAQRWLNRVAGGVFLLAGLNDTLVYWLL